MEYAVEKKRQTNSATAVIQIRSTLKVPTSDELCLPTPTHSFYTLSYSGTKGGR